MGVKSFQCVFLSRILCWKAFNAMLTTQSLNSPPLEIEKQKMAVIPTNNDFALAKVLQNRITKAKKKTEKN